MSNAPVSETNETLLETGAVTEAGPPATDPSAKSEGTRALSLSGLVEDIKGIAAMSKTDWMRVLMNEKNWSYLWYYLLAMLVSLLFVYHKAEGSTPLLTMLRGFLSITGLMGAGYSIYLAGKLQEQVEKFEYENALLEGNNHKMASQLSKFEALQQDLAKFSQGKDEKLEETLKNVTEMYEDVKSTLQDQRQTLKDQRSETMNKFFFDFAFQDGDETMNAEEYQSASQAIPQWLRKTWGKYTFETFPRATGRSTTDPITIDEFMAVLETHGK